MQKCKLLSDCALFEPEMIKSYLHLAGVLEISPEEFRESYQKKFCYSNYEECARYQIAVEIGRAQVPDSLLPTQTELAEEIIKYQQKLAD